MFVIEEIGHKGVGGAYRRVLEVASVGRDPLVTVNGKELYKAGSIRRADRGRGEGELAS